MRYDDAIHLTLTRDGTICGHPMFGGSYQIESDTLCLNWGPSLGGLFPLNDEMEVLSGEVWSRDMSNGKQEVTPAMLVWTDDDGTSDHITVVG